MVSSAIHHLGSQLHLRYRAPFVFDVATLVTTHPSLRLAL